MNEPGSKAKQQIIDKVKKATNILVTVSRDPTVDDLSAAIGLTVMLNSMGKHATAIFSGSIPPAITFLEPDKVFEGTTDSLRDFIIALDKEKADHLRYKLEGDVVKIFITPYRTTIGAEDLEFSQGDFNVELILALGVANKEHLDGAISAHGQIMKDVTVATLSAGEQNSDIGSIGWHEDEASSLSELVVSLADSLKTDKSLLDKQISTALLTGIVFATDRFSNTRTNAKVMTMAAQLMAAGADQQLIAARLSESHELKPDTAIGSVKDVSEEDGLIDMPVDGGSEDMGVEGQSESSGSANGELKINHQEEEIVPTSTLPPEQIDPENITSAEAEEPVFGGTLNATTDQAEEDNRRRQDDKKNRTILSHSYLAGSEPNVAAAINSNAQPNIAQTENIDIFAQSPDEKLISPAKDEPTTVGSSSEDTVEPEPAILTPGVVSPESNPNIIQTSSNEVISTLPPPVDQTPVITEPQTSTLPPEPSPSQLADSRDNEEARLAVESALGGVTPQANNPADIGLPLPPPLPDFSNSTLPEEPTPFDYSAESLANSASLASPAPAQDLGLNSAPALVDDPANFKIPGQ